MHVLSLGEGDVSETLRQLAMKPNRYVKCFKGMIVNAVRFCAKERDVGEKMQNSGLVARSLVTSYSFVCDQHLIEGNLDYFGELTNIIELDYYGQFKIVLFLCDWVDVTRGVKKGQFAFTLVNLSQLTHIGQHNSDNPFILSS